MGGGRSTAGHRRSRPRTRSAGRSTRTCAGSRLRRPRRRRTRGSQASTAARGVARPRGRAHREAAAPPASLAVRPRQTPDPPEAVLRQRRLRPTYRSHRAPAVVRPGRPPAIDDDVAKTSRPPRLTAIDTTRARVAPFACAAERKHEHDRTRPACEAALTIHGRARRHNGRKWLSSRLRARSTLRATGTEPDPHRSVLVQPLEVKGEITRVQLRLVEAVTERRCVPEVAALPTVFSSSRIPEGDFPGDGEPGADRLRLYSRPMTPRYTSWFVSSFSSHRITWRMRTYVRA